MTVGSVDPPQTATREDDVLTSTTRHPRGPLPEDALPGHLHARGGGAEDQSARVEGSGQWSVTR